MSTNEKAEKYQVNGISHSESDFKNEFVNGRYTNKGFVDTENLEKDQKEKEDEEEAKPEIPPVGFFSLFRYASSLDKFFVTVALIVAIASGASMPAVMIIFGKVIDKLVLYDLTKKNLTNETMTTEEFLHETTNLCIWNACCGVAFLICNYIMVSFFSLAASNQAFRIRCMFMSSVLKQDIGWYDTNETGDFASRITGDLQRIQDGIGEKVGICISFLSSTVLCIAVGLYYGWKLGLVILSVTPVLTIAMAVMSKVQASVSREEMQAYGKAGAVAEEVLSSIRTVFAFGGERKEIQRYDSCLIPARSKGVKRGLTTALGAAITWFCIFAGYALAFWYGVKLILDDWDKPKDEKEYTGGTLIIVFFNVMSASMFIGQTAPYFEAFAIARGAAAKIYSIIDREPTIDSSSELGLKPESLDGFIRLKEVFFNYPARPTVPVLRGVTLDIQPGETVALVGPSGCGKSTIIQLILRFYDTESGEVKLDGYNVKDLNVGWLRDHIGLVGQEPVLFSTTIAENIKYGKQDATQEEIEKAAKIANVHSFIDTLPKKYDTLVGERGTQLSGGQKQRIAIARALIKNPKILLLDEATSALDTESESVVQAALDEARQGRTTVVVAHRLSTIRTADKIVVLKDGEVQEVGTHDELMLSKGIYFELVSTQIDDEEELDKKVDPSKLRLLKMSTPEWPYALVGGISALLMGLHFPAFGVVFGDIIGVLSKDKDKIPDETDYLSLLFLLMAISSGVLTFLQIFMFTIAGEKLTSRLRKMVFSNILAQDMEFFDHPKNSVGSLCSRLTSDASSVQGATGSRISTLLQSLSTLVASIVLALWYNYKIGLVVLAFIPAVLIGAYFEGRVVSSDSKSEKKGTEKASKVAIEAIESIRTVASLHEERTFLKQYHDALVGPHRKSRLKSHVRGIIYGFAQGLQAFAYAGTMYYGSILVSEDDLKYSDLLK
ncbi:unnamed protein product [Larinioides sclopetarius]|uniref:ABC-type xenobiotic transporter n=1 Tax=Larinioides sclopetarius TaxID=280406 RepID=A0AAV1ZL93_9ARAC